MLVPRAMKRTPIDASERASWAAEAFESSFGAFRWGTQAAYWTYFFRLEAARQYQGRWLCTNMPGPAGYE